MVRILELTFSESSHQIQPLGLNRIFAYFCRAKNVFRTHVSCNILLNSGPMIAFPNSLTTLSVHSGLYTERLMLYQTPLGLQCFPGMFPVILECNLCFPLFDKLTIIKRAQD